MSGLNFIAAALFAGATFGGLNLLVESVLTPIPPIIVHGLEYRDGIIMQDRTVTVDGGSVFWAQWTAKIVDTSTGGAVQNCSGSGSWPYEAGRNEYSIPLPEWVGDDRCTPEALPVGCYRPIAAWAWGTDQTSHAGKEWCKQ
jgi:hypothetical protein